MRATPGDDKHLDGDRLFDRACRLMADGVRQPFPGGCVRLRLRSVRDDPY